MEPFFALVLICLIALLCVRLGSTALQLTGMSQHVAQFQAASAFFGVGFTTKEAELVVDHPVRRRIILHLIIAGNIGLTSALATLLVTFTGDSERGLAGTFGWLGITGILTLFIALVFNLQVIRKPLDRFMEWSLKRTGIGHIRDYDYLLNLRDGFVIFDKEICEGHPWIDQALWETRPSDVGVVVLGIYRKDGSFTGAPDKDTKVGLGDVLMVYGRDEDVKKALS